MFAPIGLAVVAFGTGGAVDLYNNGPFPGTPTFPSQPRIEQPYRDGTRVVGLPVLNPDSADQACPKGYEIVRQTTREDGSKVFLVWTLRCR